MQYYDPDTYRFERVYLLVDCNLQLRAFVSPRFRGAARARALQ